MTESVAILEYLAVSRLSSLAVLLQEPAFGAWLNWLHFGEATLTFPQTLVLRYRHFESEDRRQPQVAEDYSRWFLARLRHVEHPLAGADYLCASRFTAADISVGYALLLADIVGLEPRFGNEVRRYWNTLRERAAFVRAKIAQGPEMDLAALQG